MTTTTKPINDPSKAGQLASKKIIFGHNGRYAVAAVHTRFDSVQYFVWDAETVDSAGFPTVIRQNANCEAAMHGVYA
jgi:hypothetical protein